MRRAPRRDQTGAAAIPDGRPGEVPRGVRPVPLLRDAMATVGAVAVPVTETPQSVEEAMTAGPGPLERCGERLARLLFVLD